MMPSKFCWAIEYTEWVLKRVLDRKRKNTQQPTDLTGYLVIYDLTHRLYFIPDMYFTVFGIGGPLYVLEWKYEDGWGAPISVTLLDGEKIAPLCAEFGVSGVTGHKIIERYKDSGLKAFTDRSRRPFRRANRLPFQVGSWSLNSKRSSPPGAPLNCVSACGPTMGGSHYRLRAPCMPSWIAMV